MNENEKKKAAYALNLWTVSVSQIIEYDDVNIMKQEYDTIMNNLNLENMPKDEALLDVIKEIMDEITNIQIDKGDLRMVEREYQHQMKNAVWSAVPNVGAIFATDNPKALAITLATQVGIGYMNYRRNKAENELNHEKAKWNIQRNRMQHLNGLQKQLFETAWRLAKTYEFPDEYRLNAKQITDYNKALMEPNIYKRYNDLSMMRSSFTAYPAFWYQIGSTANSIYRTEDDWEIRAEYKKRAAECFRKYSELNKFNLLRYDILTSSWALEYLELLDMNRDNDPEGARELILQAERYSGNTLDVLELCAFAYLRLQDYDNAIRLFHILVNKGYNSSLNTQILSGLYIKRIFGNQKEKAEEARIEYKQLDKIADKRYILKIPAKGTDLSQWKPEWEKSESFDEFVSKQEEEQHNKKIRMEELKKKARVFYQRPIVLVYTDNREDVAEFFLGILNKNREKLDPCLPPPTRCSLKKYKSKRTEYETQGAHIILLGDSDEAKLIYKRNKTWWDYYKYGMRYVSFGSKTVLLQRDLDVKQVDDFASYAKKMHTKYGIKIPDYLCKPRWFETVGKINGGKNIMGEIIGNIKHAIDGIGEDIQALGDVFFNESIVYLQYSIAIYNYLDSENALID